MYTMSLLTIIKYTYVISGNIHMATHFLGCVTDVNVVVFSSDPICTLFFNALYKTNFAIQLYFSIWTASFSFSANVCAY